MAQTPVQATPQQMIAQNMGLRQALLASAPRMRKNLGSFTQGGSPSGTTRIKLFNVGIITKIVLDVEARVDIATAVATPSTKAPFNLINRVKLTDYDGTDRVNCSGYQLWVLQSIRNQTPYGYNNESQTAIITLPSVPTAIATNQSLRFILEIPLAFDSEKDLRGALMAQTAVGEAYVNIDWNSLLLQSGNADAVYTNATGTVTQTAATNFTVKVYQEYLLPQNIGSQVPIPVLDMMTVYEIAGAVRTSDNIANGADKLFNYPNLRSVIGFYANFINNGVMNPATTDINVFKLVANGNNVLREYQATDKLFDQRRWLLADGDLRAGTYFEMHRTKPIETAMYGNVQYLIQPSSVSGSNTNFETCFESFYTKGASLPGMSQSS